MINRNRLLNIILLVVLFGLIWFASSYFDIDKTKINQFLSSYPGYSKWILFILFYSVVSYFIWAIKDPLKIIGAFFFGAYISTLLIWVAEVINCFLLFFTARLLIRGSISEKFKSRWISQVDERVKRLSLGWIFLLRFVPLIPYRVLDTTFGFTKIDFKKYLFIVLVASPVRIFWVQYIISAVGENILKKPSVVANYLQNNPLLMGLSLGYFIIMLIVIFKLRKKN